MRQTKGGYFSFNFLSHIRYQSRSLEGTVGERCVLMSVEERTNGGIVIKGLLSHFEFRIDYDLHKGKDYLLMYSKISFKRIKIPSGNAQHLK